MTTPRPRGNEVTKGELLGGSGSRAMLAPVPDSGLEGGGPAAAPQRWSRAWSVAANRLRRDRSGVVGSTSSTSRRSARRQPRAQSRPARCLGCSAAGDDATRAARGSCDHTRGRDVPGAIQFRAVNAAGARRAGTWRRRVCRGEDRGREHEAPRQEWEGHLASRRSPPRRSRGSTSGAVSMMAAPRVPVEGRMVSDLAG